MTTSTGSAYPTTVAPITLVSFGYLHGSAPQADRVEDVRDRLRDPARVAGLLDMDGRDPRVREAVLTTPGAVALVFDLAEFALSLPGGQPRVIAIGCAGGRHRSVVLAETVAQILRAINQPVSVDHRDIHRPRLLRGDDAP